MATRSALIVATSKYKDTRLPPLEAPGQDAEALRSVLAHKEIGGFDVRLALNSRVDPLRRTLESFFADRARDDLLLVHFSGHGLKDDDGQLFLAAADTQIDRLLSTGIDAAWVNRLMNRCRSEKIALFLDCCFAGAFTTGMTRRVGVDSAGVKEHFAGRGLFVITASDAMQYSFEGGHQVGQPPEPSPFTKAFVDGLRTGEADRNEDGNVSINELFDFLEDRIRETSPAQTPTKSAFNQVGDWVIARSTRVPSVRLLPDAVQAQLKSDVALDRLSALMDLRDLIEGPDKRLAEGARRAVERLSLDDSQRVAAAAHRLLQEEATRPRSPSRTARRRAAPTAGETPTVEPAGVQESVLTTATVPESASREAPTNEGAPPPVRPEPAFDTPLEGGPASADMGTATRPRSRRTLRRMPSTVRWQPPGGWPGSRVFRVRVTALLVLTTVVALLVVATHIPNGPNQSSGGASASGFSRAIQTAVPTVLPSQVAVDTLVAPAELRAGSTQPGPGGNRVVDSTGRFTLLIRPGGDVAVVTAQSVVWHADTKGADHVVLQDDGNLVIFTSAGFGLWATNTLSFHGPYWLTLQSDGNLVLHPPRLQTILWSSENDGGCVGTWCGRCLYHCS